LVAAAGDQVQGSEAIASVNRRWGRFRAEAIAASRGGIDAKFDTDGRVSAEHRYPGL
jgi:hypothetical protein